MLHQEHIILCTTIFQDPQFDKYKDEFIIVESFSKDDAQLAIGYGFKKALTIYEVCSLFPALVPASIYDCL